MWWWDEPTREWLAQVDRDICNERYERYEREARADAARRAARAITPSSPSLRDFVVAELCPKDIVFRTPFLQRLNQHACDLAVKHGIRVRRGLVGGGGCAHHEERAIVCPPVTSEETYAVALHEFGHIVSPDADGRQFRHFVVKSDDGRQSSLISPEAEAGAWKWARANALTWTIAMQDRLFEGLRHYSRSATPEEREILALCVVDAAVRVTDRPMTWAELDRKRDAILKGG